MLPCHYCCCEKVNTPRLHLHSDAFRAVAKFQKAALCMSRSRRLADFHTDSLQGRPSAPSGAVSTACVCVWRGVRPRACRCVVISGAPRGGNGGNLSNVKLITCDPTA